MVLPDKSTRINSPLISFFAVSLEDAFCGARRGWYCSASSPPAKTPRLRSHATAKHERIQTSENTITFAMKLTSPNNDKEPREPRPSVSPFPPPEPSSWFEITEERDSLRGAAQRRRAALSLSPVRRSQCGPFL